MGPFGVNDKTAAMPCLGARGLPGLAAAIDGEALRRGTADATAASGKCNFACQARHRLSLYRSSTTGRQTSSRFSTKLTTVSMTTTKPASTNMPANTPATSNTPSACWIR